MSALPEMGKEDFQKTVQAPDTITVITTIYSNTGMSMDFKWGRSQIKIRALIPKMMKNIASPPPPLPLLLLELELELELPPLLWVTKFDARKVFGHPTLRL